MYRFVSEQKDHFRVGLQACDLTPPQAQVLMQLGDGPLPMAQLATRLACHASNVTGLVDRLEERELIERRPASHDRRLKLIGTTARGQALREQLLGFFHSPPPALLQLPAADLEVMAGLLRKLAR
jgi:DNA-binding MarR family transcriptional regulator